MAKSYQTHQFGDPPPIVEEGDSRPRDPVTGVLLQEETVLIGGAFLTPQASLDQLARDFDSKIERSPHGGLNSKISGRWDLIDTEALTRLASVLEYGASKYSEDNWRLDPVELHLKHALEHIFNYLKARRELNGKRVPFSIDGSKDELGHSFCRVMFALGVEFMDEDYLELVRARNGVKG